MANDNGGRDNVSVVLVKVQGDYSVPDNWWQKLLAWLK
jgi:protein phosphatase